MPIFGQVWLWSSLAFLLGALLCWALVALPARRRVGELEDELASYDRHPDDGPGSRHSRRDEYAGYDDRRGDRRSRPGRHEEPEPFTRGYAAPGRETDYSRTPAAMRSALDGLATSPETDTELADGPRSGATQYLNAGSGSLGGGMLEAPPEVPPQPEGRGWFDDDEAREGEPLEAITQLQATPVGLDRRLVDDEGESDEGGTVFTQRTHPIPGELIRQLDEAGRAEQRTDEPADALVDDLADEDAGGHAEQPPEPAPAATPSEFETEIRPAAEVTSQLTPDVEPTAPARGAHGQTEVMPAHTTESPTEVVPASGRRSGADKKSRRGTDESKIMPGVTVHAEPASNPLPKRVPSKPRGHTPFGVETSPTPEPAAASTATASTATVENDAPRSLFEPIVPAEDSPVVPPPHRVRGDGNGRGPFGPGSAMPLPDGASPSPEFTIKASVSALRYCTPESPQFGRTVAEVWFKSSADAERVGFRPVG